MKPGTPKESGFSKVKRQRDEEPLSLSLTLDADPQVAYLIFRQSCKPCVFFMPKSNANQTAANAGLPLGDLGSVQLSCFLGASPGYFTALSGPLSLTEATHGTNLHLRLLTRLLLTNLSICGTIKPTWQSLQH